MRKLRIGRGDARAELALAGALLLPGVTAALGLPGDSNVKPAQGQPAALFAAFAVVREIDDPSTGKHWLLMRDLKHPGGPGVLVSKDSLPDALQLDSAIGHLHPVIRAGDRLTVERSGGKADLRLEGIALSPAAQGAPFRVRLATTGKVILAVALGPRRAVWAVDKEFWP